MKQIAIAGGFLLCAYVFSYLAISPFGAYAPSRWGLNKNWEMSPRAYAWAPPGFYDPETGKWSRVMMAVYRPLSYLDERFWHNHGHFPGEGDPEYPAVFPDYR